MLKNKPEDIIMQDSWMESARPELGILFLLLGAPCCKHDSQNTCWTPTVYKLAY